MGKRLAGSSGLITTDRIVESARQFGTPQYLYDEQHILDRCRDMHAMREKFEFGMEVRYAMKANSNRAVLQMITGQNIGIDASSLAEVERAILAGFPADRVMLTTQEVPVGERRRDLERLMSAGMKYNACSLRQLSLIADFASANNIALALRIHPGTGTGESATRNTGDKYSCFGVHLSDIDAAIQFIDESGLIIDHVHEHIGSGGDPLAWRENIDLELGFVEQYFPHATRVSFGGGLKTARMPGEIQADLEDLGEYAASSIRAFERKTGRKLVAEVEPGTYFVANAGYLVTSVVDIKQTGPDGYEFIVLDGGMEVNARPLLYGSRHPFYVISYTGELLSSEFDLSAMDSEQDSRVVVGRCCESGDSQSLDETGHIVPRVMARPEPGDYVVIGGCGAYCSAMTPFNYNSHVQSPEVYARVDGSLSLIRKRQSLEQIIQNEYGLDDIR